VRRDRASLAKQGEHQEHIVACCVQHLVVLDSLLAFAVAESASNRAGYKLADAGRT
jgi:hypothetical protein